MPTLQAGRNYLLLVSHFSNTQSGYKLSFGGGTAVITDPAEPHLGKAEAACGGDVLGLKLSKKIRCASIARDGSEFFITPTAANVTSSVGIGCSSQFDTDSLELRFSGPLSPGTYTLHIRKGSDGNTLLDYCDRPIAETETVQFTVFPKVPTPMDSLAPLQCAPNQLKLVFKRSILCASVAADGSDFTVNGSYPVSVTNAAGVCTNGKTKEILVSFSSPLQVAGNFQIVLKTGSDGNTLIDECSEETPAGSALPFSVKDTVNADFTYAIRYGCSKDTVNYFHPGKNGVNTWKWTLDEGQQSSLQNAQGIYSVFNQKKIQLVVSNGFCSDSAEKTVLLDNFLKADFTTFEDNCPLEPVPFTSQAVGKISGHNWDFGDGGFSNVKDATHIYAVPNRQTVYTINYT
ncbi:MAG: PKD domain-containing protein, partial [Chitinophagaceae bacterium]